MGQKEREREKERQKERKRKRKRERETIAAELPPPRLRILFFRSLGVVRTVI